METATHSPFARVLGQRPASCPIVLSLKFPAFPACFYLSYLFRDAFRLRSSFERLGQDIVRGCPFFIGNWFPFTHLWVRTEAAGGPAVAHFMGRIARAGRKDRGTPRPGETRWWGTGEDRSEPLRHTSPLFGQARTHMGT